MRLDGRLKEVIPYIKKNMDKERIAVLVSGDPGLYSLSASIGSSLKKEEYEIIPGISTLQIAFARIGESWEDVKIISVHGRGKRGLVKDTRTCGKVFLLTDTKFPPEKIADYLLRNGIKNRRVIVLKDLTYPHEKIVDTDLKTLANERVQGLCVMIIKK